MEANGSHYARTAEAWLQNMDRERTALKPCLLQPTGARMPNDGCNAGGCFSWPVRNCLGIGAGMSGSWRHHMLTKDANVTA